jgi:hypothetical protein
MFGKKKLARVLICLAAGALLVGCGMSEDTNKTGETGRIQTAIGVSSEHPDVTAVHFKVVRRWQGCEASPIAEAMVPLEEEALPIDILPEDLGFDGGAGHRFADALFVLDPGRYKVCAIPKCEALEAAEKCGGCPPEPECPCTTAHQTVRIFEGMTTEALLVMNCDTECPGALDVIGVLNDCPEIDDLLLEPSKFIMVCQCLKITVLAADANEEELHYEWAIMEEPAGSKARLRQLGLDPNQRWFRTNQGGRYELRVRVYDAYGAMSSLTFPVYVSGDCVSDCEGGCEPLR